MRVTSVILTLIAVAGLAVDAFVHLDLASNYDPVKTSVLSQGDLFRAEAITAIVVALALLVRPRWYTSALAVLVAGSALGVLLLYRYVNVKAFGPIPSMYEPVWYAEKTRSAYAEGLATLASLGLLMLGRVSTSVTRAPVPG